MDLDVQCICCLALSVKMYSRLFAVCYYLFMLGSIGDALICYMCPRTDGGSPVDANTECLALGWELSCALNQDRCYSTTYVDTGEVEKGCTQSQECLGSASCCQGDFCNAVPQNSQTGYGQPCSDLSSCFQGPDVMRCDFERPGDSERLCLCANDSYQRGATCRRKSYPDEPCLQTTHCSDVNSTCVRGRCQCDAGMFANNTRCDYKRRLGDECQSDRECGGLNTECSGIQCACAFGFLVINGTNSCSGCARTTTNPTASVLISVFMLIAICKRNV